MKQIFEVTLMYTAMVLAKDSDEAEQVARLERDEITSDDTSPVIECGVSFRSRKELADHGKLGNTAWDEDCLPYGLEGDDNEQTLGQILERIEEADGAAIPRCKKTVDMFEPPKPVAPPSPVQPPNFREMVAHRFAGGEPGWHWSKIEYIGEGEGAGALIEGGVPNLDHEGKRRWTGVVLDRVFVSEAQVAAEALAWERSTGKCLACGGSGQENTGWCHKDGEKYRTCTRCNGDGKALAVKS